MLWPCAQFNRTLILTRLESFPKQAFITKYPKEDSELATIRNTRPTYTLPNTVSISIIIPVFNEEKSIENSADKLRNIASMIKSTGADAEIIFVNDGSTDASADILMRLENDSACKVITHKSNRGYGAALKTGIRNAKNDIVCIIDCDGTYPFNGIIELVKVMGSNNYDMVVGARTNKNVDIPIVRRPAKWALTILASFLAGVKIQDLNSGLRIIKKCILEKYIHLLPNGFSFTSTITLAMLTNNYDVCYVPIDYYKRSGKSKIRPIRDTLNFIQLTIRMVLYFNPLKIFLPLCLPLILLGGGLIAYQAIFLRNITSVSIIISLAGIQLLAIGMIADLIDKRMG